MARVTAYEASDGSLHRDKKEWIRHESNLIVAQKLKPIVDGLIVNEDEQARQGAVAELHDFIVNGIGLNTLRELFAIQFKPGADDTEPGSAPAGEAVGEVAETDDAGAATADI